MIMNIEDARLYCLSKQDATEDFPFDETTLAFRVENKIFAVVDHSYEEVLKKLPKKLRLKYGM